MYLNEINRFPEDIVWNWSEGNFIKKLTSKGILDGNGLERMLDGNEIKTVRPVVDSFKLKISMQWLKWLNTINDIKFELHMYTTGMPTKYPNLHCANGNISVFLKS